jgi:hypothetical protein
MSDRYFIHTPAEPQSQGLTTLLSILEGLMPVKFSVSQEDRLEVAGEILTAHVKGPARRSGIGVSSLRLPKATNASREGELVEIVVRFSDDPGVPFPFRGRSLRTKVAFQPNTLSLGPDERLLATCDAGPVWALSEGEGVKHFRSAFALPALLTDSCLRDVLNGDRFLEILPLLHWLREICGGALVDSPALKACFIFDDPNLHWPRYGFVDYRELAARAERENYHVSFATIPLDSWFTHRETANIFRKNQARLSLLVHGNNHTLKELARAYTQPERIFLLKQAIQRIERLERQSGIPVSRIMVPPHGACSDDMLAELPICGFEAACISHGSLRKHNKSRGWTKNLGFLPFELVRGCPVFPRWGVTGDAKSRILLAAYLNQAIILNGHHQDLKDGPELLDELAQFVNGLGSVEWLNMTDMARSNDQWRTQADLCRHKNLGRKVTWSVTAGGVKLQADTTVRSSEVPQVAGVNGSMFNPSFGEVVALEAATGAALKVASKQSAGIKTHAIPGAPLSFIRRLLTEGRDRLLSTRR